MDYLTQAIKEYKNGNYTNVTEICKRIIDMYHEDEIEVVLANAILLEMGQSKKE